MSDHDDVFIAVITTAETEGDARRIASALVEQRLVACAQIDGPMTSVYRWKGAIETASEYRLTAKCRASRFADVSAAIKGLHPYEVPQIVAIPLVALSTAYENWLRESTETV